MTDKTILIQSYRTSNVPVWIEQCQKSAKSLAASKGWEYRSMGDELFDLLSPNTKAALSHHTVMLTDLTRLIWASTILEEESKFSKVIWLDSDVFVFAPEHIQIDSSVQFAVGRQHWVQKATGQKLKVYRQVHNAILVMGRQSLTTDFLIQSINQMIDKLTEPSSPQMFGPKLLTALHNILGFSVVESIGMGSPLVLKDIADGGGPALAALLEAGKAPLGGLNLCGSYQGCVYDDVPVEAELFLSVIDRLRTCGLMNAESVRQ